jgi:ferredoxin
MSGAGHVSDGHAFIDCDVHLAYDDIDVVVSAASSCPSGAIIVRDDRAVGSS